MVEENNDLQAPQLMPSGDNGNGPRLQLKGQEGPQLSGQKKCPHCERMIPESDRICLHCGFDTKSGKTQQERNRKSGTPVKMVLALAVLAGIAYAGYTYQNQIKDLLGIKSNKPDTEITDNGDATEANAVEKVTLDFEIEGEPEEFRETLEMQIEDLQSEYEVAVEELSDAKAVGKEAKAEYEKAKKAELIAKTRYEKYKANSKSKTRIEDAKYSYRDAIDLRKEMEGEYKLASKEYGKIKANATKAKKQLADAKEKLQKLDAYIEQQ